MEQFDSDLESYRTNNYHNGRRRYAGDGMEPVNIRLSSENLERHERRFRRSKSRQRIILWRGSGQTHGRNCF